MLSHHQLFHIEAADAQRHHPRSMLQCSPCPRPPPCASPARIPPACDPLTSRLRVADMQLERAALDPPTARLRTQQLGWTASPEWRPAAVAAVAGPRLLGHPVPAERAHTYI